MDLTKRRDGWYVEFPVVDDGKTLTLARGTPGAKLKRWKTNTINKTVAKQQEAKIKADLMMRRISSDKCRSVSFAKWAVIYLGIEGIRNLRTYQDRVNAIRQQMIPFFGNKPLNGITQEDVEAYRRQRFRKNSKPATLGNH